MARVMSVVICVFYLLVGTHSVHAQQSLLQSLAQRSEEVQIETLANGMTLFVHERLLSEEGVSLRLVWNPPLSRHLFMGWDLAGRLDVEWQEDFFQKCRSEIIDLKAIIDYPSYWGFGYRGLTGDQFAVIVVGNITVDEIRPLVELYFDDLFYVEDLESQGTAEQSWPVRLSEVFPGLQREWIERLLQQLFEDRLEATGHHFQEEWLLHPHWGRQGPPKGLAEFLEQVAHIKVSGYTQAEFTEAKAKLIAQLQVDQEVEHALLASFYSDLFHLNEGPANSGCVELSSLLIQEIVYEEVEEDLESFLEDAVDFLEDLYSAKGVELRGAFVFAPPGCCDAPWQFDSASSASWRLVNDSLEEDRFDLLALSSSEMRQIHYIITTLAEHNVLELAFKKRDLEKRGKRINQVHPLRFMGYILSTSHLRKCAYEIEKSSFKWDAFVGGFAKRMKEEHARGNVMPYIRGFAELLGAPVDQVIHYVHKKNFEGLVRYLM